MGDGRVVHVPVLRLGVEYTSLDVVEVVDHRDGEVVARVGQANAGMVRRDLRKLGGSAALLRRRTVDELVGICGRARESFLSGDLALNDEGDTQSSEEYVRRLSATSGMPEVVCRANMEKIATVLGEMAGILRGLTRGMDLTVLDEGVGRHAGVPVSFANATDELGAVLPSNSPGVHSIWIPSIALKTPVVLKPGREEPWTPLRIVRALIDAGAPREAFSLYPTTHEGAAAILEGCGRSLLFGDARTTAPYARNPAVQVHGPGFSKVVIGEDEIDGWEDHLDVLVQSVADNGGRSCINASAIYVPSHADEIAEALAERLARVEPLALDDPKATLSAFANPRFAESIDAAIEQGLASSGAGAAEEVTARFRAGPRRVELGGSTFLRPTVVRCARAEHPLANTEYLFPYTSVVELPSARFVGAMGPTLVVTAITRDAALREKLIRSPHVQRLNLGPYPTTRVDWDQPHEGNLFELLYVRRAIARHEAW